MGQSSTEIVRTIASREEVAPTELSPKLFQAIEPEALDTLLERDSVRIAFEFTGYRVLVDSNGNIQTDSLNSSDSSG